MTSELRSILATIADMGRVEASTENLRYATDKLFELGYLNIAPPGWAYVVNDAGRAELAKMAPAKQEAAA